MIDFVVPVRSDSAALVAGLVDSVVEHTRSVYRFLAVLDGGTQAEIGALRTALAPVEHVLLHNPIPEHLIACLRDAREHVQHDLTAILMPHVRLSDPQWFAKIYRVFEVDHACQIVDTIPGASAAPTPTKRIIHRLPDQRCPLAVVRSRFFKATNLVDFQAPIPYLARAAIQGGGSAWLHGGVNYFEIEHKEMKLWRDSSAAEAPSKSRSQTTRA